MGKAFAGLAMLLACAAGAGEPPPRTVDDVLLLLEQVRPDPQAVARLQAEAAAEPPAGAGQQALAVFHHRRARAHAELGNLTREIADLERALELALPGAPRADPSGLGRRQELLQELRAAEVRNGNEPRVIELSRATIQAAPNSGTALYGWTNIISASLRLGDLDGARQALRELESGVVRAREWRDWSRWEHNVRTAENIGHALLLDAVGNFREGERRWRAALAHSEADVKANEERLRSGGAAIPATTAIRTWAGSELNLAGSLRSQGRLSEAEAYSRSALLRSLATFGRASSVTATAMRNLAGILYESGRYAEAARLARFAAETLREAGAFRGSARIAEAKAIVGAALVAQGRYEEAARVYAERDADLQSDAAQAARLQARLDPSWGYALLRTGQVEAARAMFDTLHARLRARRRNDSDYATAQMRGLRGLALAAAGQKERAFDDLSAAVPVLVRRGRELAGSEQAAVARQLRLGWILEGYLELLWELRESPLLRGRGLDAAAEAFRIADFARASRVQRALAASAGRSSLGDPELAALASREQDALQRIQSLGDLVNRLLAAPPARQLPGVVAAMQRDIESLRAEHAKLRAELVRRFPEYAELVEPQPPTLEDVRRALAADEALVSIYAGERRSYAWAIRAKGPAAFAAPEPGARELAALVERIRRALDPQVDSVAALPRFDVDAARRLHDLLLAPVADGWKGAGTLLVVPHGALAGIPFALLVTGEPAASAAGPAFAEYRTVPWLLREAAIVHLPSAQTLLVLRRSAARREVAAEAFAGFGDPRFGGTPAAGGTGELRGLSRRNLSVGVVGNSSRLAQLAPLPDTAEEIRAIAAALGAGAGSVFLGPDASERTVRSGVLRGRRVVAFATHGLVPGELDGLTQPALALSAPEPGGSGGPEDDGLLSLDEILALRLDADWVVLSACNTGAGDGSAENGASEAVSGLGRGFFFAGARSLLVSHWPVETVSARRLTSRLFERQAGDASLTRAQALRETMLELLDRGEPPTAAGEAARYTYAHPLFWAPFSLIGEGGLH